MGLLDRIDRFESGSNGFGYAKDSAVPATPAQALLEAHLRNNWPEEKARRLKLYNEKQAALKTLVSQRISAEANTPQERITAAPQIVEIIKQPNQTRMAGDAVPRIAAMAEEIAIADAIGMVNSKETADSLLTALAIEHGSDSEVFRMAQQMVKSIGF